jgi:serine/threonine protein kinase
MEVFIKILTKQPDYPEYVDNHSKMVIDGLLEKEPKRRFSAVEMKNDPWFSSDFESFGHLLEEEEERVSFKLGQIDSE